MDQESLYPNVFIGNHPFAKIDLSKSIYDLKKAYDPETDTYELQRKLMVEFLHREDDYLAEAIIEFAKKEGVSTLYLIDKEFVVTALNNELKRRRNGQVSSN